jgi:hypothetical protein
MNGKDSKGITLRNGWGRDWPVRSDEFVADLVGGGEAVGGGGFLLAEKKRTEKKRRARAGAGAGATLKWMCGALPSGAQVRSVAPLPSAPHILPRRMGEQLSVEAAM